jgi:transcriptional regulator with XRE-family HTH domain
MKERGLSQQALAEKVGISQGMVAQYLRGHRGKPADSFQAILDALDLELTVTPKSPPEPPQQTSD